MDALPYRVKPGSVLINTARGGVVDVVRRYVLLHSMTGGSTARAFDVLPTSQSRRNIRSPGIHVYC